MAAHHRFMEPIPRRICWCLVLLIAGATALVGAQPIERVELACGLPLIIVESHAVPLVSVRLAVRAGTAQESDLAGSGAALLGLRLAELRLRSAVQDLGAAVSTDLTPGAIGFTVMAPPEALPAVLAALAGLAAQPAPDGFVLDHERMNLTDETGPDVNAALIGMLVPAHPGRWPAAGLPTARALLTPTALHAWRLDRWRAGRAALAVVGNVRSGAVRLQAEQAFADFPAGGSAEPLPTTDLTQDRRRSLTSAGLQPQVVLTWPVPGRGSKDHGAMLVVAQLLALGLGEAGAVVTVRAEVDEPARLDIALPLLASGSAASEQVALQVLGRFAAQLPDQGQLERARLTVQYNKIRELADAARFAAELTKDELITATATTVRRQDTALQTVTGDDLRRVVTTWLWAGDQARPHGILVLTTATPVAADNAAPPLAAALVPPQLQTLPSGVRVVVRASPDATLASIHVLAGSAVAMEADDQAGVSALLAAVMIRASETRTPEDIAAWCADHGLHLSAGVRDQMLDLGVTCASAELPAAVALLADLTIRPALPPDEIGRARAALIAGLSHDGTWSSRLQDEVARATGAGHFADGRLEAATLAHLDRAALVAHRQRLFVTTNTVIALTGVTDAEATVTLIAQAFAGLIQGPAVAPDTSTAVTKPGLVTATWHGVESAAALAWPLPISTATDGLAQQAADAVFDRLINGQVAPGGWQVRRCTWTGQGLWTISGLISGPRADTALTPVRELLASTTRLANASAWPERLLEAARAACLVQWAREHQEVDGTAFADGRACLRGLDPASDATWPARIRAVRREDLLRSAAVLAGEPSVVVLQPQSATPAPPR